MKRQTIGKIQLWIGIVLLIAGIVGLYWSYMEVAYTAKQIDKMGDTSVDAEGIGRPISEKVLTIYDFQTIGYLPIAINFLTLSLVLFILSLLFMTQGLANMSMENRGR